MTSAPEEPARENAPAPEEPARKAAPAPDSRSPDSSTGDRMREGSPPADEQAVADDLDRLVTERDEYLELARRAKADFENYRKRAAREASEAERRGTANLARELLPAIDNLERALRSAGIDPEAVADDPPQPPAEEKGDATALGRGVALVLSELQGTLARAGVESYDPVGERFDPSWHEALQTRPAEGTEPGVVVETLERGYRLDGQVLRAARVVVSA